MAMKTAFVSSSLRTGCLITGWMQLVSAICYAAFIVAWEISESIDDDVSDLPWENVMRCSACILLASVSITLLYGTSKNRSVLLTPYISYCLLDVVGGTIFNVCSCFTNFLTLPCLTNFTLKAAMNTYCLCVVWSYYFELRRHESANKANQLQTPDA